jgi:hypothetical protein
MKSCSTDKCEWERVHMPKHLTDAQITALLPASESLP